MRAFAAALTNLTVIPVPGYRFAPEDLERSKPFFPFAGLLIGGIMYAAALLPISQAVLAVVLTALPVLLTRGFHLDGLADSADALMSSRSRERMLEIMRDSHIGTMGVFAMAVILGLQAVSLGIMPVNLGLAVLLSAVCGRCAIVIYICLSRYVRPEGSGKLIFQRKSPWNTLWAAFFMLVTGYLTLGSRGLAAVCAVCLVTLLWHLYTLRKLGGGTGDTIGACEIMTETAVLVTCAIYG